MNRSPSKLEEGKKREEEVSERGEWKENPSPRRRR